MSAKSSEPLLDEKVDNPKVLAMAGSVLFGLGLIAFFVAWRTSDSEMILYTAILLALGYPGLLYARTLRKLEMVEKRLKELEK